VARGAIHQKVALRASFITNDFAVFYPRMKMHSPAFWQDAPSAVSEKSPTKIIGSVRVYARSERFVTMFIAYLRVIVKSQRCAQRDGAHILNIPARGWGKTRP